MELMPRLPLASIVMQSFQQAQFLEVTMRSMLNRHCPTLELAWAAGDGTKSNNQ